MATVPPNPATQPDTQPDSVPDPTPRPDEVSPPAPDIDVPNPTTPDGGEAQPLGFAAPSARVGAQQDGEADGIGSTSAMTGSTGSQAGSSR